MGIDFQKIEKWLKSIGAVYYRIEDLSKKKRAGATKLADDQAVFQHFKDSLEILPDGKYVLVASDNPSNSRASVSYPFEKGGSPIKGFTSHSGMDLEAMLAKAKEEGRNEARWENMVEKVGRIETKLDKFIEIVSNKFDELENDNDGDIMEKVENVTSVMELAKDKFKDFKL